MPGVILRNSKVPVIPYDTETLSSSRITSQLICPSRCTNVPMPWLCETCGAPVFFSLSDWCYCYCGKYNVNAAEYRCNEPGHELATPTDLAVPLEKYNIAVICKARELRTKWLTWVIDPTEPIGCPYATYEVRQAQRLFRFVDLTHEHDLKEFHAVCIVTPFYGNIRPHLFEAVAVLGKKAVKNVFVCMTPRKTLDGAPMKTLPENLYRLSDNLAGLGMDTETLGALFYEEPELRNEETVLEFLDMVCSMDPLERQLMDTPPTPEEAQNLALGLKDFCQLIGKTLTTNIDCLEHDRSSRRKAFVLTSSFLRPKLVPQLFEVGADSTGDTIEEDEFQAKILVGCTMKEMDPEAAREELERLEESKAFFEMVERQLDFCLKFTIQDEAGVELILRLKDDMLASRYREEALEYLNAATRPSKGSVLSYVVRCQSNSLLPLPKMCPNALVEEEITTSSSLDSNFGSPRKLRGGRRRRARGGRNRGRGGRNRRSRLPDCSSC